MKKYFIVLSLVFCTFLFGCKVESYNPPVENDIANYPMLKVENQFNNSYIVYSIELPNHTISPVEIRSGESITFTLCNGMLSYKDVTVHIRYGVSRSSLYETFRKVDFTDGETTTITLK